MLLFIPDKATDFGLQKNDKSYTLSDKVYVLLKASNRKVYPFFSLTAKQYLTGSVLEIDKRRVNSIIKSSSIPLKLVKVSIKGVKKVEMLIAIPFTQLLVNQNSV